MIYVQNAIIWRALSNTQDNLISFKNTYTESNKSPDNF